MVYYLGVQHGVSYGRKIQAEDIQAVVRDILGQQVENNNRPQEITHGKLHDLNLSPDFIQIKLSTMCENKNACRFWQEDIKERDRFDGLGEDEWMIFKWIFSKQKRKAQI